ncbi:Transposon Ty3-G Gag-Pol polyprotein [Glycine soja]|uniref:Transposon Ty3-G Gag-Pol polyprotein n=1 Tax=Glycine soja TaxID=3848 RepID=A0A445M1V9_GLYSO|nr:Transposon Ty3-G Gag-Pol polyprotein [Glycine soja]
MGLGGVLMQNGQVVTYASRQLKTHERNYPTHDLELAAVVLPLRFGDIICLALSSSYHPDKANVVADALSRKSLHMSSLMVREMDLLELFRDLSLACEVTPNSVRLGTLRITSELLRDIREGQKIDPFLRTQLEAIESGRDSSFNVGPDGVLRLQDRICVPNVPELRKMILEEGHRNNLSIHPGATKMYHDNVLVAQHEERGLPRTPRGLDSIWVIVDRLTKSAHFIPINIRFSLEKLTTLYISEVVRLHGVPSSIVSDRDPRFTSRFWESLNRALGIKLRLSSAYHPQTDGQTEQTIQSLEDLLRACVLEQNGSWESFLPLIEFTYNNSFHSTIGMAPYEALYGRRCRTPLCWLDPGEGLTLGPEVVQQTTEKVKLIQERMRTAQSRQKSYHDKRRKDLEFEVGDHVFLRVTPWTGVGRALKSRKLTPRFIGPFQILKKVRPMAYQIALPPSLSNLHNVFHVSQLRKYIRDPSHVIELDDVQVKENLTYETLLLRIEDRRTKHLRGKEISLVKVIWGGASGKDATWELESQMREPHPSLFEGLSPGREHLWAPRLITYGRGAVTCTTGWSRQTQHSSLSESVVWTRLGYFLRFGCCWYLCKSCSSCCLQSSFPEIGTVVCSGIQCKSKSSWIVTLILRKTALNRLRTHDVALNATLALSAVRGPDIDALSDSFVALSALKLYLAVDARLAQLMS